MGAGVNFYAPAVDPYDSNHLIMAGHETNNLVQSTDGGQTWSNISMDPRMNQNGGTAFLAFINTGNAPTTRMTLLYMAQGTGGLIGTWRTTNGGASWTRVESVEHNHGSGQIYQPDTSGVVFMAGPYGTQGWGVYRSIDYGVTWTHVGIAQNENIVFGTPSNVYSGTSGACQGACADPSLEHAAQPAISSWTTLPTPMGMINGPAQTATVFNGTNYIIISANWDGGIWRYVESASGATPTAASSPSCSKLLLGDILCHGTVDLLDYSLLVANFGKSGVGIQGGDLNNNGVVDLLDYSTLIANFGK